jgi:DNA polymerase (family 10)
VRRDENESAQFGATSASGYPSNGFGLQLSCLTNQARSPGHAACRRPLSGSPRRLNPQNQPIAQAVTEIANLLELQRADPVRIRAYRKAAWQLGTLSDSLRSMLRARQDVGEATGIAEGVVGTISEIAMTGTCGMLERLHEEVPADLSVLLQLPHLGPQRVRTVHEELGVNTVEQLHAVAADGKLQSLPGFGPRLEHQILKMTIARLSRTRSHRLDTAVPAAHTLLAWLAALPEVTRAETAGSLRRCRDCVEDLELLVQSAQDKEVVTAFSGHPDVAQLTFLGRDRVDAVLRSGLPVRLHVAPVDRFGAAWLQCTGASDHVAGLARLAHRRSMTLDAEGLSQRGRRLEGASEEALYERLELPFIAPELREGRGEIEAAATGALPRLVDSRDLRGDLHVCTRAGSKVAGLPELAAAAAARGLEYIAVADHARRVQAMRSNDLDLLCAQMQLIDQLNARSTGLVILKGLHVEILEDGRLNVPDSVLAGLDLVVAAVGHLFELTRGRQTSRVLRAMDNAYFSVLGTPTGRLIEERRPMSIDLARVFRHARERGCFIELNSQPGRLDLDDAGCRLARREGVLVCINSAACTPRGLDDLRLGVGQARRGWLEARDVANALPLSELKPLLDRTMSR